MNLGLFEKRRGTTAERTHRRELLHPECPIEQTLRGRDDSAKAELARIAWRRAGAGADDDTLLVAEPDRVRVLARSEAALALAVARIASGLEGRILVRAPSVRYVPGNPVLEPHMIVIVSGPERYLALVQRDMVRRRGRIVRASARGDAFMLEAETPLAELIGYTGWLADLTEQRAPHVSAWLSRYLPIDDGGPRAA